MSRNGKSISEEYESAYTGQQIDNAVATKVQVLTGTVDPTVLADNPAIIYIVMNSGTNDYDAIYHKVLVDGVWKWRKLGALPKSNVVGTHTQIFTHPVGEGTASYEGVARGIVINADTPEEEVYDFIDVEYDDSNETLKIGI